ncbi:30S ribosomal protein S2 [Blastomyces dermatitidis ER-3]|uniref:30S ribosomal protein S2 n=1 Tax=Ajellomyces dermatitidis (strain ER-3 / ATCC MYA-2586) TaxID=559297 RepID=A0ABP2EVF1_AJEDR|nr:30S ribosomal protein S2 [Blastomyces dermatitidis ER-3]EEQ87904.2 30S ribosomal protein S2 [Blastomyces dermatitidis ER-3]
MIIRRLFGRQSLALLRSSSSRTTACGRLFATDSDPTPPPPITQRTATSQTGSIPTTVLDGNAKSSLPGQQTEENAAPRAGRGDPVENPQEIAEASGLTTAPAPATPAHTSSPTSSSRPTKIAQPSPEKFHKLGSVLKDLYRPESLIANPPRVEDITLELLLASQTHLGHATSLWNPANAEYIFGIRQGVHIISLDVTAAYLRRAAKVVREVARHGGLILFVGTRKGQRRIVVSAAERAKGCHVFQRWDPRQPDEQRADPGPLREAGGQCLLTRPLPGLRAQLEQLPRASSPDLVCGLHTIPTIGIIDTDANPTHVTYPIPANDDSLRSVAVIAGVLGRAGEDGQRVRLQEAAEGKVMYAVNEILEDWKPKSAEVAEAGADQ